MNRSFQRTKEDFTCLHCQTRVSGDGYTNHCPACLWSRHVDIAPGDRLNECLGLMEPIGYEPGEPHRILHRCTKCGHEGWNRIAENDAFEAMLALGVVMG